MSENVFERLPRLLALVPWLSARPGVTFSEASEHFGISVDQLTTDLYQLVVCGLPGYGPDQLVDIDFYDLERIWVTDPQTLQTPMRLTAEESAAMSIALRLLAEVPGFAFRNDVNDLLAKLEAANIDTLRSSHELLIGIRPQVEVDTQQLVDQSLRNRKKLGFQYLSGSQAVTDRLTSPVRVFSVDDYQYLEAYCESAEARRLFRLDRINKAYLVDEPAAADSQDGVFSGLEAITQAPTATLRLTERTAWLAEEPGVVVLDSTQLLITIPYLNEIWLARWILGIGGGVTVVEPSSIVSLMGEMAKTSHERITRGAKTTFACEARAFTGTGGLTHAANISEEVTCSVT